MNILQQGSAGTDTPSVSSAQVDKSLVKLRVFYQVIYIGNHIQMKSWLLREEGCAAIPID
jgi:hypothetical protein